MADDAQQTGTARSAGAKATGPGPLGQLLHDRSLRLAAALAVVVAIPVTVLFYFQFQSLDDLEQTSGVVLRQLSRETADGLTKSIEEALKSPHIRALLRIGQGKTEPLDLPWIEPILVENFEQSPFIDTFYVWSDVSTPETADRLYVLARPGAGQAAGELREDAAAARQLLPLVRDLARRKRAIVTFPVTLHGRPSYFQAQLRFNNLTTRDRMTSFVAFAVDADRLRHEYFPAFLRERLATLEGPKGFAPLAVALVDDEGATAYDSSGKPSARYVDEREFPLVFFDKELLEYAAPFEAKRETWRLRTGYGPLTVAQIVSANTRPQVVLMAALAVLMACGVFFVAGAAAREMRLAELKSSFVSSVSHDLKTPLALIQLFAETLELGRLKSTERATEYYRIINMEARKLTRLIDNILDFSKMEAGLRPYRVGPADLGDVTRRVLASFESQFKQNQFTVTTRFAADLPPVMLDGDAVEQAIENLLSNAIKYSGDSREIEVSVGRRDDMASVSVTDHGIGVPRQFQKKIFRKFYRIEMDTGGGGYGPQGCGLGLAIVDHTMRGHGGQVRVDSDVDRGSTFSLCFPIPAGGEHDEAHSGDRGRAADAARTA